MGIKTVPHPPYSQDLAPCDFCLFPKLRGCHYETIEEMKEAMTKVIDTLTQEDINRGLPEVVGMVQQVHCSRRRLLWRGLEFNVCTINKSAHTKKSLETYLKILVSSSSSSHADSMESSDSLAIHPYWPSLLAGPLDCIQCPHTPDISQTLLVSHYRCIHIW